MTHKFDIPQELFDRAKAAADLRGVPVRRFLLDAILDAVEDVEDYQAAERAMEAIRNGDDKRYTLSELGEFIEVDSIDGRAGQKAVSKAS